MVTLDQGRLSLEDALVQYFLGWDLFQQTSLQTFYDIIAFLSASVLKYKQLYLSSKMIHPLFLFLISNPTLSDACSFLVSVVFLYLPASLVLILYNDIHSAVFSFLCWQKLKGQGEHILRLCLDHFNYSVSKINLHGQFQSH